MNAFEIIQVLTKGFVPVERCGTTEFETSDMSELSRIFGRHYAWSGHMFKGKLFYCYCSSDDDWSIDDADIIGFPTNDDKCVIHIFKITEE